MPHSSVVPWDEDDRLTEDPHRGILPFPFVFGLDGNWFHNKTSDLTYLLVDVYNICKVFNFPLQLMKI